VVDVFPVHLTPSGTERTVRVYTPAAHGAGDRRFPVLYMLDGHNLFDDADASYGRAWRLGAHLDAHGPEVVVVGVDAAPGERRTDEYTPWPIADPRREPDGGEAASGGGGRAFVEWLVHELKPAIDARYRTDPAASALAGASLGGLMAIYGAAAHPTVFRRAAALSAAVVVNETELVDFLNDRDLHALERLYVDVGTQEWPDPAENDAYRAACARVAAVLAIRVRRFRFDVIDGGEHHEASWEARLGAVLGFLYGR
jgi:predicted alpha/beta superfamily hydrolase